MNTDTRTALRAFFLVTALSLLSASVVLADLGPVPPSLKGVPVPEVPGLTDGASPIVVDRAKAIALGKALFWDTNVGSDGMACASCHFHAGADRRTKNQIAPGAKGRSPVFDLALDGTLRGPNYALTRRDFPLTQTNDPVIEPEVSGLLRTSDDVVGSAGTFGGTFRSVELSEESADTCDRGPDAVFHVNGVGTRRVVERNAPSVINAAYNHRSFWDGRANNIFNGSSSLGERDKSAGVWVKQANGSVVKQTLRLVNSSLASQALAPPASDTEMSCSTRSLADVGRKLMWRRPLENQAVAWDDSVLGTLANSTATTSAKGLKTTYSALVRQAFASRYWSATMRGPFGAPQPAYSNEVPLPYNQFEANFGMFFALAIQLYEETLVSDDAPFDRSSRDAEGVPVDLTPAQQRGFELFRNAHCNTCHIGPLFTSAALETNAKLVKDNPAAFGNETFSISTTRNVVTRTPGTKGSGFIDTGFAATGVGSDDWDIGLASVDSLGNPLSYAQQYLYYLAGLLDKVVDSSVAEVRPCDLQLSIARNQTATHPLIFTQTDGIQPQTQDTTNCFNPTGAFVPTPAAAAAELAKSNTRKMLAITDSAFKIPTLRNVELTGPYMHNGSMATLDEVIEFYSRGGNFAGRSKQFGLVFPQPELQLDAQARQDLKSFLLSLTDERVRFERAPFDHPEINVPHGHVGNHLQATPGNRLHPDLALDAYEYVPAVGAGGRATPLQPFDSYLAP
jgi:cytochrome c peroxidase